MDASQYAKASIYDGVHIAVEDSEKLANAITDKIKEFMPEKEEIIF